MAKNKMLKLFPTIKKTEKGFEVVSVSLTPDSFGWDDVRIGDTVIVEYEGKVNDGKKND